MLQRLLDRARHRRGCRRGAGAGVVRGHLSRADGERSRTAPRQSPRAIPRRFPRPASTTAPSSSRHDRPLHARLDLHGIAAGTYSPALNTRSLISHRLRFDRTARPRSSSAVLLFESDLAIAGRPVRAGGPASSSTSLLRRSRVRCMYPVSRRTFVKGLAAGGAVAAFGEWPQAAAGLGRRAWRRRPSAASAGDAARHRVRSRDRRDADELHRLARGGAHDQRIGAGSAAPLARRRHGHASRAQHPG